MRFCSQGGSLSKRPAYAFGIRQHLARASQNGFTTNPEDREALHRSATNGSGPMPIEH